MFPSSFLRILLFGQICAIFLLFSNIDPVFSQQNQIDVLKNQLPASDEKRLEIFQDLLPLLYKEGTEKDILTFFPEGIDLAIQYREFDNAAKWSIELYHIYERRPGEKQKALELMEKAADFSKNMESSILRGSIFLKLAAAHYNLGDFDTAIEGYSQAIEEFEVQDSI